MSPLRAQIARNSGCRNQPFRFLNLAQSPFQVRPELVCLLESDAEPEQPGGNAVSLPAMARLHGRVDTAQAGGVCDQPGRSLDPPRRLAVDDVERDQAPDPWVADELPRRVGRQAARELARGRRLALDTQR